MLMNAIRSKAVVLYFQPFSSIKLERMSQAFGWTVDEVERHVVNLIQSGDIQGRIDSQNKVGGLLDICTDLILTVIIRCCR
jgi:COP9 signalosome complex subunit 1